MRVEKYASSEKKRRQNSDLQTWIWRLLWCHKQRSLRYYFVSHWFNANSLSWSLRRVAQRQYTVVPSIQTAVQSFWKNALWRNICLQFLCGKQLTTCEKIRVRAVAVVVDYFSDLSLCRFQWCTVLHRSEVMVSSLFLMSQALCNVIFVIALLSCLCHLFVSLLICNMFITYRNRLFHLNLCKEGIDQQIFNRKSISRKITHPQSLFK